MRSTSLVSVAAATLLASAAYAAEPAAAQPDAPQRIEVRARPGQVQRIEAEAQLEPGAHPNARGRIIVRGDEIAPLPGMKLEKGAYLGVATSPLTPALREQLELPQGVGLVVDTVPDDSPAGKAGLKQYDVLHKLDDQILVNQQQLAVLIRTFKPGYEVKLSIIRNGKPQEIKCQLIERELRPLDHMRFWEMELPQMQHIEMPKFEGVPGLEIHPLPPPDIRMLRPRPGAALLGEGAVLSIHDGKVGLTLTVKDGKRHLVAKDNDGKVLYDGPVDTEEQRKALPEDVRTRLEKLNVNMHGGPATRPFGAGAAAGFGVDLEALRDLDIDVDHLIRLPEQHREILRRHQRLLDNTD